MDKTTSHSNQELVVDFLATNSLKADRPLVVADSGQHTGYRVNGTPKEVIFAQKLYEDSSVRQRLEKYGAKSLLVPELLSIIIGKGTRGEDGDLTPIQLGSLVAETIDNQKNGTVGDLRFLRFEQLENIGGIDKETACRILAAVELGKRSYFDPVPDKPQINDPVVAVSLLQEELMWQEQEKFAVIFMDCRHQFLSKDVFFTGSATETLVSPQTIFREALKRQATRLIVAHNHPSGNVSASAADLQLTKSLIEAGRLLEIKIQDHLIFGKGGWNSLRSDTCLWYEE